MKKSGKNLLLCQKCGGIQNFSGCLLDRKDAHLIVDYHEGFREKIKICSLCDNCAKTHGNRV